MAKKTSVKLNKGTLRAELTRMLRAEQTMRLVNYAEQEIANIGVTIATLPTRNQMDRTGHLLDSLCWGVYYNGRKEQSGFYREAVADDSSYLHEYSPSIRKEVDGRGLAKMFLSTYNPSITKGWEVVFAICAPYWGYWEKGHENPPRSGRTQRFRVMAEHYDYIGSTLGKKRVELFVNVPSY